MFQLLPAAIILIFFGPPPLPLITKVCSISITRRVTNVSQTTHSLSIRKASVMCVWCAISKWVRPTPIGCLMKIIQPSTIPPPVSMWQPLRRTATIWKGETPFSLPLWCMVTPPSSIFTIRFTCIRFTNIRVATRV